MHRLRMPSISRDIDSIWRYVQNSRESEKECLQFQAAEISYVTGMRSIVVWLVFHALCVWPLAALCVFHRKGSFNAGKTSHPIIGADCTRRFCLQSSLLHSNNDCCISTQPQLLESMGRCVNIYFNGLYVGRCVHRNISFSHL